MPDYTKNLGHTINFSSDLAVCREPVLTLDVSDDYLMFDNPEEATFVQFTNDLGRDGKVNTQETRVHLCHTGRYVINARDLLQDGNAHLEVGDIRAEVSMKELNGLTPKPGDRIMFADANYSVLGQDKDPLTHMFILWCRE
jgi:hypothetical protein